MNLLKTTALAAAVIVAAPTIAIANSYTLYRSPHSAYSNEGDERVTLAVFDADLHLLDGVNELFNETYCQRAAVLLGADENEADDVVFWCERD